MADQRVAIWYWRYHAVRYAMCENEQEAAAIAWQMQTSGEASVDGVQFADSRTVPIHEWEAYRAYEARMDEEEERQRQEAKDKPPPEPIREVGSPFNGHTVKVWLAEEDAPWLGDARG